MKVAIVLSAISLPAALAASGAFDVLTFNVAGLPEFLQPNGVKGGKENAAKMIGTKFAQYAYDIIHVQEDFNYHKYLYGADNHTYRTATSGPVPFGSGLNTLANFNWTKFDRKTWSTCFINEADCLTPKGFTFMRVSIAKGVTIDCYNLHMDAGGEAGDQKARASNIQQVSDYIEANSKGQAVIVFGDTNTRYSRPSDDVRLWMTRNGLTDSWVQLQNGGVIPTNASDCPLPAQNNTCEIVDKVLYRSGKSVQLNATTFNYVTNMFLQPDGNVLSDHNPIKVDFVWST